MPSERIEFNDVICDYCNEDFTNSDEVGGISFGSYAICPRCAPRTISSAKMYNEDDRIVYAPKGMSFKKFVQDILRGGKPGFIEVTEWQE